MLAKTLQHLIHSFLPPCTTFQPQNVKAIYLYGSRLFGTNSSHSDYDFVVVVNNFKNNNFNSAANGDEEDEDGTDEDSFDELSTKEKKYEVNLAISKEDLQNYILEHEILLQSTESHHECVDFIKNPQKLEMNIMDTRYFLQLFYKHNCLALLALYLPISGDKKEEGQIEIKPSSAKHAVVMEAEWLQVFRKYFQTMGLQYRKLKYSILSKADILSYLKAKRILKGIKEDGDESQKQQGEGQGFFDMKLDPPHERAKKLMAHGLRYLVFGKQILEHGRIVDFGAGYHEYLKELLATPKEKNWEYYEHKYKPVFSDLKDQFAPRINDMIARFYAENESKSIMQFIKEHGAVESLSLLTKVFSLVALPCYISTTLQKEGEGEATRAWYLAFQITKDTELSKLSSSFARELKMHGMLVLPKLSSQGKTSDHLAIMKEILGCRETNLSTDLLCACSYPEVSFTSISDLVFDKVPTDYPLEHVQHQQHKKGSTTTQQSPIPSKLSSAYLVPKFKGSKYLTLFHFDGEWRLLSKHTDRLHHIIQSFTAPKPQDQSAFWNLFQKQSFLLPTDKESFTKCFTFVCTQDQQQQGLQLALWSAVDIVCQKQQEGNVIDLWLLDLQQYASMYGWRLVPKLALLPNDTKLSEIQEKSFLPDLDTQSLVSYIEQNPILSIPHFGVVSKLLLCSSPMPSSSHSSTTSSVPSQPTLPTIYTLDSPFFYHLNRMRLWDLSKSNGRQFRNLESQHNFYCILQALRSLPREQMVTAESSSYTADETLVQLHAPLFVAFYKDVKTSFLQLCSFIDEIYTQIQQEEKEGKQFYQLVATKFPLKQRGILYEMKKKQQQHSYDAFKNPPISLTSSTSPLTNSKKSSSKAASSDVTNPSSLQYIYALLQDFKKLQSQS